MTDDYERESRHEPIKIRWSGDTRTKFLTRHIEPLLSSDDRANEAEKALDVITRQKTQLVVRTFEEACVMRELLLTFEDFCGRYGAIWATEQRRKAVGRVRQELFDEMEKRGWQNNGR